jgi:hypothetical protein
MRRSRTLALAALLIVSSLSLAGCARWFENPAKPANDAIAVANTHLKKAAVLEAQAQTDAAGLETVSYTKAGAVGALKVTKALKETLAEQKAELVAAKEAMDGIEALEVAPEFKEYAKLQSTAIETRILMADTDARLYAALEKLYAALKAGKKSKVEPDQVLLVIDQVKNEITALAQQATEQTKAATDFFTENRLGG